MIDDDPTGLGSPFDGPGVAPDQKPIEEAVEVEIPATTAPVFPVEKIMHNSAIFFQRMIGGGMQMKIVPLIATQSGNVPSTEAVVVEFGAEGWERFKGDVSRDGVRSQIETVRTFPGGMLNGGAQ